MDIFWKTTAGILISSILAIQLNSQKQEISLLLKTACCAMASVVLLSYLSPILDFLKLLEQLGDLKSDILMILLKCLGIGITSEIAGSVCNDAGSASLGKTMNLLGTAAILYLSLPIFQSLIELVQQLAEET